MHEVRRDGSPQYRVAGSGQVHAIPVTPRLRLGGPNGHAARTAHRLELVVERATGRAGDASLDGHDVEQPGPRDPCVSRCGASASEIGRPQEQARGRGNGSRDPAEQIDDGALVVAEVELGIECLVGSVCKYDQIGRTTTELLGEMILAPPKRREHLSAVDAKRVEPNPCASAVQIHPEDAHVPVPERAELDLMRRVRYVEHEETAIRLQRARGNPTRPAPVDEDVEAAAVGLLPVVDFDSRGRHGHLRPCSRSAAVRANRYSEQAVAAVARDLPVLDVRPSWLELLGHAAADAVLDVGFPRLTQGDEAPTPIAKATLQLAT